MFKKLFKKIKDWVTGANTKSSGGGGGGKTTNAGGSTRASYDRVSSGGSQYGMSKSYKRALVEQQKKQNASKKKVEKAFKATDAFKKEAVTQYQSDAKKAAAAKKSLTPYQAYRAKKREETKAFHARTNNKYNTQTGTAEQRTQARQRIKMGMYQEDPEVAKFDVDYHPIASSMARGAVSGATLGLSELGAKLLAPTMNQANREAEEYYQKNKSRGAELAGEMLGSLPAFGMTGSLTREAAGKAAKKVLPVERIASSKLVQRAAAKEALKTLGSTASKEEVQKLAMNRAVRLVEALGEDAAINLTTGAVSDISHAIVESDNPKEFMQNMAVNGALNVGLGGITTAAPELLRTAQPAIDAVGAGIDSTLDAAGRKLMDTSGKLNISPVEIGEGDQTFRYILSGQNAHSSLVPDNETMEIIVHARNNREAGQLASDYGESLGYSTRSAPMRVEDTTAEAPNNLQAIEDEITKTRAETEAIEKAASPELDAAAKIEPAKTEPVKAEPPKKPEKVEPPKKAEKVEPPKTAKKDDVSQFATIDDDAAKVGIESDEKVKTAEAALKQKDKKFKEGRMPKGEKLTQNAKKKYEGSFDEAVNPPTYEETKAAKQKHLAGQASDDLEVVSRGGTSFVSATTSDEARTAVNEMLDSGALNYRRINNREKFEAAAKNFIDNSVYVGKKILEWADDISNVSAENFVDAHYQAWAVAQMMRNHIDDSPEAKRLYSAAVSVTQQLSSMSGQLMQFQKVMVHCDARTRFENALDNIATRLLDSRGFVRDNKELFKGKNIYQRRAAVKEMLLKDKDIDAALKKVFDANTPENYGDAMQELLLASYKIDSKTLGDVINEWRYLAMLGNPKTHVRNILGSAFFSPIRQTSNIVRSAIADSSLVKNRAGDLADDLVRYGGFSSAGGEGGKVAEAAFKEHKSEILGSLKYEEAAMKKGGAKTPIGKFFNALSNFNSAALGKEDDFFRTLAYKRQYAKSYNSYLKKGTKITEEITDKIHQEALRESRIATFNEWNEFATTINKYIRSSRRADASFTRRMGGTAVNTALPFTKVPANILKQSFNYSPAGIFKGYANIVKAGNTGDRELLNRAIDEFASGLTGTGIMGLGLGFGMATDRFTTNAGKDDAAAKFKKQQGIQNYSVRIGDHTYTLDWLTPVASTFFMGVELANQLKDNGARSIWDMGATMSQITSRVIDPVLETSMLSGLYNIVESSRNSYSSDDEKLSVPYIMLRELVQNYINSLIPTAQGQLARTFAYDSDRQIVGDTDTEYWVNATKVKLGLADKDILTEALGADTDAYGNVKNKKVTKEDYAKSALKNFLSPSNIQKYDLSPTDQKKIKMYEDAVKAGEDPQDMAYLFPKKQYKRNFKVGNIDVKMSNKDLSTYNQAKTKGGEEGMRYLLDNYMFNEQTVGADGKKQPSENALSLAEKAKLMKWAKGKSLREVETWLMNSSYYKKASEADRKKAIDGLWSYSKQGKSQAAKRVGEQAVVKAQGKDVNEYNFNNEVSKKKREALQPLIDSGIVTYEEAVDFARYAGKTYYYEGEDGAAGHSQTYYNKGVMLEYLEKKGYSPEKAAALFNAFKAWNAKEYGAPSYRRGYRRRGYRRYGYRRRGRGGGGRAVASELDLKPFKAQAMPTPKKTASTAKVTGLSARSTSSSDGTKALAAALKDIQKTEKKVAPPRSKGGSK